MKSVGIEPLGQIQLLDVDVGSSCSINVLKTQLFFCN